jgi:hypothetical protein
LIRLALDLLGLLLAAPCAVWNVWATAAFLRTYTVPVPSTWAIVSAGAFALWIIASLHSECATRALFPFGYGVGVACDRGDETWYEAMTPGPYSRFGYSDRAVQR